MGTSRRNLLIGIGTAAIGSGAVLGSGAFTQVQANRSLTVDVAGDANAFLALNAVAGTDAVTNAGGGASNQLEIDLSASFGSGDGVNDGAFTTIGTVDSFTSPSSVNSAAFTITNQGSVPVDVSVSSINGSNSGILSLPTEVASGDHNTTNTDFSSVADLTSNTLEGLMVDAVADVAVMIDTTGDIGSVTGAVTDVTFQATTN